MGNHDQRIGPRSDSVGERLRVSGVGGELWRKPAGHRGGGPQDRPRIRHAKKEKRRGGGPHGQAHGRPACTQTTVCVQNWKEYTERYLLETTDGYN
jgi:hypothetical protein